MNLKLSYIICVSCFAAFQLPANAEDSVDVTHESIAKIAYGVFCSDDPVSFEEAPDTVAGLINIIEDTPDLVRPGSIVPAANNVSFGVRSKAQHGWIYLGTMVTITHPPMGDSQITSQSYRTDIESNRDSHTLYRFDFDYELLPGDWTITAVYQDKTLFRRSFEVVDPRDIPELAIPCGFEDLIG